MLKFYHKTGCGACRKAKAYLDRRGLEYEAIEITKAPPAKELLAKAIDPANPKASLHSRCGAFRKRELAEREVDAATALSLMTTDPGLIKRPFFVDGDRVLQGFEPAAFETFLG